MTEGFQTVLAARQPWQNRDKTPGWAETVAKSKSQQYQ
jgi:hypothetical protein